MSRVEKGGRSFRPLTKPNNGLKRTPNPTQPSPSIHPEIEGDPPRPSSSNQPDHQPQSILLRSSNPSHPQPIPSPPPSSLPNPLTNPLHPTPTPTRPLDSENDASSYSHIPQPTPSTAPTNSDSSPHPQPIEPHHVLQPKPTNLLPTSTPTTTLAPIPSNPLLESTKPTDEQAVQPSPPTKPHPPIPIDLSQPADHRLSPAEKMKLKAKAAKAARAIELLKNPSSSRRSTSILSTPALADQQSVCLTQSDGSPQVTATQVSSVEDIPVPDLTIHSAKLPPPNNKPGLEIPTRTSSPPIDPVLAIAAFVEDTATINDTRDLSVPDILVSTHSSHPPPPTPLTQTNLILPIVPTNDEPDQSKTSARKSRSKRSAPIRPNPSLEVNTAGSEQEEISPRLRRKRRLEKSRDKKNQKSDGTLPEAQNDQATERPDAGSEKAQKRVKRRLESSNSSTGARPTKRKKARGTPTHGTRSAHVGPEKDGHSLDEEDEDGDTPLDPTEVSMAELTNPNRQKGQTSEVLEKRIKLIIERRDREKLERMMAREETKKQARQVLIDRVRAIKSKQKEQKTQDPSSTDELVEQEGGSDNDHPATLEGSSAHPTDELPPTEDETRKKLLEQYGLEDLDSEEDMEEYEEVIFDEFAKGSKSKKSSGDGTQNTKTGSNAKLGSKNPSNGANYENGSDDEEEVVEEVVEFNEEDYAPQASQYAPQLRVVNGQIVLDQDSLEVDRRDQSPELEDMEVVEESDATRLVNSQTWMKSSRCERWTADETSLFYDAVRLFGSDFEMITQLFPGRTRRQIRSKWNKEEKRSPQQITDALMGKRRSKPGQSPSSQLTPITEELERDGPDGENGKEEGEGEGEEEEELVIPSQLDGFADYARIVGIDCSGPIPLDPMDKWREKERLEYEEEIRKKKKEDGDANGDDDDDDDDDMVVEPSSGWGEVEY